jgi:hypothetical protein
MGRDREYDDNADRQRAYRERKAAEEARLHEALRRQGSKAEHQDKLRKKLVRVLGMLGSGNAGERDNAARMATQIVKDAGLTWYDVLNVTDKR